MDIEEVEALIMERWAHHISPDASTGCWLWTGGTTGGRHPYAQAYYGGKTQLVNKIVKTLMGWQAQDVRHKCGVKLCVNPRHLTFGTRSQNVLDRSVEDRQESHRKAKTGWTAEMLSERNKKVRAAQLAAMPAEWRSEAAAHASKARWAGKTPEERQAQTAKMRGAQTAEQLSANAQKANAKRWGKPDGA
jgi:hypothetical protein